MLQSETLSTIKSTYNQIVKELIENRNQSGYTQDSVAKMLGIDRRKIIDFENLSRFDFEILCNYCDIYGIQLKLKFVNS